MNLASFLYIKILGFLWGFFCSFLLGHKEAKNIRFDCFTNILLIFPFITDFFKE